MELKTNWGTFQNSLQKRIKLGEQLLEKLSKTEKNELHSVFERGDEWTNEILRFLRKSTENNPLEPEFDKVLTQYLNLSFL